MRNQTFGIEIELTGLTRERAAEVIATYFGTSARYAGGAYRSYEVKDNAGRTWKLMHDSSIRAEFKHGVATEAHRVELVSPICKYEDIETIQEIIRLLCKAGAKANDSAGIHVHVGMGNHTASTLRNLANLVASKEDLIYTSLGIKSNRSCFCEKADKNFIAALNAKKPQTLTALADIWYAGAQYESRNQHYHSSRYRLLNFHSIYQIGTVEFRAFNSTTHAGKIKSYIQFCLAMSNQALTQKSASHKKTVTTNEKYTYRTWLLRLGMIGDEFKTARGHLLANLQGNIAWRNAA